MYIHTLKPRHPGRAKRRVFVVGFFLVVLVFLPLADGPDSIPSLRSLPNSNVLQMRVISKNTSANFHSNDFKGFVVKIPYTCHTMFCECMVSMYKVIEATTLVSPTAGNALHCAKSYHYLYRFGVNMCLRR